MKVDRHEVWRIEPVSVDGQSQKRHKVAKQRMVDNKASRDKRGVIQSPEVGHSANPRAHLAHMLQSLLLRIWQLLAVEE